MVQSADARESSNDAHVQSAEGAILAVFARRKEESGVIDIGEVVQDMLVDELFVTLLDLLVPGLDFSQSTLVEVVYPARTARTVLAPRDIAVKVKLAILGELENCSVSQSFL